MAEISTIKGIVHKVFDTEVFASGFQKRILVIKTDLDSQYPQTVPVELLKDKVNLLDGLTEGDEVSACVNLRGSEYQNRFFVSLNAWKIDSNAAQPAQPGTDTTTGNDATDTDCPF